MTTTSSVQVIAPQTLNTMTFPLHGARLIEASAGTGKTFTIAGLYLRLLLGHGTAAPQGELAEATRHHEPAHCRSNPSSDFLPKQQPQSCVTVSVLESMMRALRLLAGKGTTQ